MKQFIFLLLLNFVLKPAVHSQTTDLNYSMVDFGSSVPGISDEEIYCLTKNVYFEAGIENGYGKFAVALTTLNRVRHKKFPNTVCEVVYQGSRLKSRPRACQFSWSCDRKTDRPSSLRLWHESLRIATLALRFPEYDITDGATHYHAVYVNPGWAKRLTRTGKIGKHIFYR